MSDSPPTSNRQLAIMLLFLAFMLPIIFTACQHKLDESYANERKQTAKWRAEQEQKPYISPADQVYIDIRDSKP